jgi:CysZ protein
LRRQGVKHGRDACDARPMLNDLAKAVGQLSDPATRRWVWLSVVTALLVILGLIAGIQVLLALFADTGREWLDWVIQGLAGLGSLVAAWFLFPAAISAVLGLFAEQVVDAVEARHYPALPPPRSQGVMASAAGALRLGALALLLNLLVLPLYLIPGINLIVALLLNGYLLGREYFETVALRRLPAAEARALRSLHRAELHLAGAVIAALLLVPVVNLVAPIIGVGLMTHRFHRLR